MRLTVVTLSDGEDHQRIAALTAPLVRAWCNRHGYRFVEHRRRLDPARPAAWSKVLAVQEAIPESDWVFWIDADVVLLKPEERLDRLLERCGDVLIQENDDGINSGLFAVRNVLWAVAFLKRVYASTEFLYHGWWEQRAMMELLAIDPSVQDHFTVLSAEASLQGFYAYGDWAEKMFVHFSGMPAAERLEQIERIVALAARPEPERAQALRTASARPLMPLTQVNDETPPARRGFEEDGNEQHQ